MIDEKIKKQIHALIQAVNIEQWEKEDLLGRLNSSTPEQLEKLLNNLTEQLALDIAEGYIKDVENRQTLFTEEPDVEAILNERLNKTKEEIFTKADIEHIRTNIEQMVQISPDASSSPASPPMSPSPLSNQPSPSLDSDLPTMSQPSDSHPPAPVE